MKNAQGNLEDDYGEKVTVRAGGGNILGPERAHAQDKHNHKQEDARQPVQQFPHANVLIHRLPWPSGISYAKESSPGPGIFIPSPAGWITLRGRNRGYLPANLPISENSGKYIEITTPPTTKPRKTIMTGSRAVSKSFTAASTSSS